jgi:hypothetical protein
MKRFHASPSIHLILLSLREAAVHSPCSACSARASLKPMKCFRVSPEAGFNCVELLQHFPSSTLLQHPHCTTKVC